MVKFRSTNKSTRTHVLSTLELHNIITYIGGSCPSPISAKNLRLHKFRMGTKLYLLFT